MNHLLFHFSLSIVNLLTNQNSRLCCHGGWLIECSKYSIYFLLPFLFSLLGCCFVVQEVDGCPSHTCYVWYASRPWARKAWQVCCSRATHGFSSGASECRVVPSAQFSTACYYWLCGWSSLHSVCWSSWGILLMIWMLKGDWQTAAQASRRYCFLLLFFSAD